MAESPLYRLHRPGVYRRRLRIQGRDGWTRADLEDDPHRYGVALRHDGQRVTAIEEFPMRTPWSLCTAAAAQVHRLLGMPLSPDPTAIFRHTAAGEQCTHVFDTAGLAVAHAARGTCLRDYEIEAPFWTPDGSRIVALRRDGVEVLRWTVHARTILSPAPYAGLDWQKMLNWAREQFTDPDDFEAVVILRRAVMISNGRSVTLDPLDNAADTGHVGGACYVFQPGTAERAKRIHGSTLDFTDTPEYPLADLRAIKAR